MYIYLSIYLYISIYIGEGDPPAALAPVAPPPAGAPAWVGWGKCMNTGSGGGALGLYTILSIPILDGVWHTKGGSRGLYIAQ